MLEIGTFQRRNQPSPPEDYHSQFTRPVRPNARYPRPSSFNQLPEDTVSPSWPPSNAGRSDSQTLVDGHESRASLRSWRTGNQTPVDSSASPRYLPFADSGPTTPMVRLHKLHCVPCKRVSVRHRANQPFNRIRATSASPRCCPVARSTRPVRTGAFRRPRPRSRSLTSATMPRSGRAGSATCTSWCRS